MTDRKREPLPEGYQFGDASLNARMGHPFGLTVTQESREQMGIWDRNRRRERGTWNAREQSWNVIEGEHFSTDRDHGDETTT